MERIASMAVRIDIKKELEAKLYPTYEGRLVSQMMKYVYEIYIHTVTRAS